MVLKVCHQHWCWLGAEHCIMYLDLLALIPAQWVQVAAESEEPASPTKKRPGPLLDHDDASDQEQSLAAAPLHTASATGVPRPRRRLRRVPAPGQEAKKNQPPGPRCVMSHVPP